MIPDKLYISQLIYGTWQYQTPDPDDETQVEYIRKDALLEWAEDVKAKTGWYEIEVAMDDLIDKINSL